jgi:hypothetical protein
MSCFVQNVCTVASYGNVKFYATAGIRHFHESNLHVRFQISTAVSTENAVFWDVTPHSSVRSDGGTYRLHHQGEKNQRARNVSSS